MTAVASFVVFSSHPAAAIAFYRALGVQLDDEDHGDGRLHAAGEVGDVHLAVVASDGAGSAEPWRSSGSTFVGLWVDSLDASTAEMARLGAPLLRSHEACAWGCRIVVADPDGRPIELNERGHCPIDGS